MTDLDKVSNFLDAYENAFMNGDSMKDFYDETIDIINDLRADIEKVTAERDELIKIIRRRKENINMLPIG